MSDETAYEASCYICQKPSVVVRKGANRDYGLCEHHVERAALTQAWQAVDRAIRPLGYYGGASNSPWNKGYEQAKNEALNAILALRNTLDADADERAHRVTWGDTLPCMAPPCPCGRDKNSI